jgi:histidinol-phosphate/aromatic aminotransferase/cobyric acid decarboxylase-like protein
MVSSLIREHLTTSVLYSPVLVEVSAAARVYPDVNQNSLESELTRYSNPNELQLTEILAGLSGVSPEHLLNGSRSDEPIDLALRMVVQGAIS